MAANWTALMTCPHSRDSEQKFVKEPIGRGPPRISGLRTKIHQDSLPSRTSTPAPLTPYSPARSRDELPRFARDTNASRMAREHVLAQRAPSGQGAAPSRRTHKPVEGQGIGNNRLEYHKCSTCEAKEKQRTASEATTDQAPRESQ